MDMDTATDTGMDKKPTNRHKPFRSTVVLVGAALTVPLVAAQSTTRGADQKPSISISTRVTVTETWTDNVRLTNAGETERITEVQPGIHVDINKARVKGVFDYALSGIAYANSTAANRTANTLSSNLQLEAIDNTLFLDATGTIGQQATSAFGAQSVDNTSINANSSEVSTYRISPYLRGHLGTVATYLARYSRSVTSSKAVGAVGSAANEMSLNFKGDTGASKLGWTADVSSQDISYNAGRTTENSQARLGLTYAITPLLQVSADAGTESNNYTSLSRETSAVNGVGVSWQPMGSTKFSAVLRRHSYGDTYTVSLDHRTGRTVWQFSDSKETTQSPGVGGAGSAYDLYYAQFATTEPDPVARAQLVNAYLQTFGISPGALVNTGFATSSLALQHRQMLSFALLGKRDTVTFIATQSDSTRLDALTTAVDDFTTSPTVHQQGWSGNFAHRLTPDYSLGLLVSQMISTGTLSTQSTNLRNVNLSLTGKVGRKSSATLGVRKVESINSLTPYSESALTATINLQL